MKPSHPALPTIVPKPSLPTGIRCLTAWIMLVLLLTLCGARAAGNPDDDYVVICFTINSADTLNKSGNAGQAHEKYLVAREELAQFQAAYPNWNNSIVAFRQNYVAEKIAATAEQPAVSTDNGQSNGPAARAGKPVAAVKSPVKLLDAGSEPRMVLRLHPAVGDKQTLNMTLKMGMNMSAAGNSMPAMDLPAMLMTIIAEVKSIAANGDIAYEMTYDDATVATDSNTIPAVATAMKASLANLRGMTGTGRLSDRGLMMGMHMKLPANADPQLSQVLGQMKDSFSSSSTPFPDEAVGPGAKWEYQTKIKSQGMVLDQTIVSELVSAEGDHVNLRNTITQNAVNQKIQNPAMPGVNVDLTKMSGEGSGNSTFDLSRLLPVAATLSEVMEMAMAFDTGQQKQTMDMKMNFSVTIESK